MYTSEEGVNGKADRVMEVASINQWQFGTRGEQVKTTQVAP